MENSWPFLNQTSNDDLNHNLMNSNQYLFRPVRLSDAETLYGWAISADIRRNAINQEMFSFEHHFKWLESKLTDPNCKFFVLEYNNLPVGQIRIDKILNEWILDFSIDSALRGKGFGKKTIEFLLSKVENINLVAHVLETNMASIHIFETSGFRKIKEDKIKGRNFFVFEKQT
jgi:RimJ/RimL family protein N-acetyltransferase